MIKILSKNICLKRIFFWIILKMIAKRLRFDNNSWFLICKKGWFLSVTSHTIVKSWVSRVHSWGHRNFINSLIIKKNYVNLVKNFVGNNKMGGHSHSIRENFLGIGALTPRNSPYSKIRLHRRAIYSMRSSI